MFVKAQKMLSKSVSQVQEALKSAISKFQGSKQQKSLNVDSEEIALVYDASGKLLQVMPEGNHLVDVTYHVITLSMCGMLEINFDLAQDILKVAPVLKNQMQFYELKENHYLLIDGHCELKKKPGVYVWWKDQGEGPQLTDIDCEQPDLSWLQVSAADQEYLKKSNIICEASIKPDETDILLHYYKNELVEVIQRPGTYVFCNHKGQHVIFPISSWQTCLKSQVNHPMLAEYTKTIHLACNQLLMVKKGIFGELRLFDKAGEYYFWNLPGDDMIFEVIDCNQLFVPKEDRDKLAISNRDSKARDIKAMIESMPNHWEEYQWRYLIADRKILKEFAPEENVVWLWKKQAEEFGAKFRMIPHLVQTLKLASQTVYTKDKTAVKITCVIPYSIPDPQIFIQKSEHIFYNMECSGSITSILEMDMHIPLQMALRELIQNYTVEELIEKRQEIQNQLYIAIKSFEEKYGLAMQAVHLRDIILTKELQEILNQVIVAEKKVQIKGIERRDEVAANRSLINTSKLLQEHPGAFALRKLQTVEAICEKIQTLHLNLGGDEQL